MSEDNLVFVPLLRLLREDFERGCELFGQPLDGEAEEYFIDMVAKLLESGSRRECLK